MPALVAPPLAEADDERMKTPPSKDRASTGNFGNDPAQFPIIIFSHGLAGNRLSYS